jgi:hypothetical protein
MTKLKVGNIVEPIRGCLNHGFTAEVVKICDERVCIVKFSSHKVSPLIQVRTIENLIKCG